MCILSYTSKAKNKTQIKMVGIPNKSEKNLFKIFILLLYNVLISLNRNVYKNVKINTIFNYEHHQTPNSRHCLLVGDLKITAGSSGVSEPHTESNHSYTHFIFQHPETHNILSSYFFLIPGWVFSITTIPKKAYNRTVDNKY